MIPQFGPMRTAERRAQEEGKVLADNAVPLLSSELESIKLKEGCKSNLFIDFFMPAIIIVGISIGTYIILGSTLCLAALVVASAYQVVCMLVRRMATLKEIVDTAIAGIKSVMSAILILPFCLSLAAGSDHIAHVKTQMPYAITGALIASIGYLIIGMTI